MTTITLPPLPKGDRFKDVTKFREIGMGGGDTLYECWGDALRARDLAVAKAVLEGAAKLKADAMEIFNSSPAMTPQETRDVIEWYSASLSAMEVKCST